MQFLPHYCVLCELPVEGERDLCAWCHASLPWNLQACPRCAAPLSGSPNARSSTHEIPAGASTGGCVHCLRRPPLCSRTIAPLAYAGACAVWVQALKFRRGYREGQVLASLLADAVQAGAAGTPGPDLILPLPLSAWRLVTRGHNQALILARCVAARMRIPLCVDLLRRSRHTARQADLPRSARRRNVAGAFSVRRGLSGQRLALVDDVFTTGATLDAATRALLDAGAGEVQWWVAARTT